MATTFEDDSPGHEEEGNAAENEVTPLVGAVDQSTNQTSNNHDLIDQNCVENGGCWQSAGQQEIEQQQWCSEEPCRRQHLIAAESL